MVLWGSESLSNLLRVGYTASKGFNPNSIGFFIYALCRYVLQLPLIGLLVTPLQSHHAHTNPDAPRIHQL